jgi:rSAM/selenodomain-associated transferase 1
MRPATIVMAKAPLLGLGKTRLAPVLEPAERLALHRALLTDKLAQVRSVPGLDAIVAFTPAEAEDEMRALVGGDVLLMAQRGEDLGERLANASGDGFAAGRPAVLLVDSDTPTLPPAVLSEAIAALEATDLVLGPAWDGGYYLMGLGGPCPALFEAMAWSTPAVLAETVRRARRLGLSMHFLPAWFDLDTPADLALFARTLGRSSRFVPGHPAHSAPLAAPFAGPAEVPRDEVWQTLSSRLVYQNRWLRIAENVVDVGSGALTLYGVVTTSPCVGVLPLVAADRVLLVRQFRYVARRHTWEIPTGGVHAGESLEQAARRELREEAGLDARRLEHLSTTHTSKSILDEEAHLYLAEELFESPAEADHTEQIQREVVPISRALAMVDSCEIVDAMSVIALLTAAQRRGWRGGGP